MVELLVYIAVMVLVIGATSYFVITTYNLYKATLLTSHADQIGMTLLKDIVRQTRSGVSVDVGNSDFDVAVGSITFQTLGGTTNSYELIGDDIVYTEGANDPVVLNPGSVAITRFLVTSVDTPVSQAVRYDIGVSYTLNGALQTQYYQGVAILRQSYE